MTHQRQGFLCDADVRVALREAIVLTRAVLPFEIEAWVLLPNHMHAIWRLPDGDVDYGKRWALIKRHVTKLCGERLHNPDRLSLAQSARHEKSLWQRRFWEHCIIDEDDFQKHFDYIHFNPVKHGLVGSAKDWPHSSFHRFVKQGIYELEWCDELADIEGELGE